MPGERRRDSKKQRSSKKACVRQQVTGIIFLEGEREEMKKMICVMMAACMCGALAGCGGSGQEAVRQTVSAALMQGQA